MRRSTAIGIAVYVALVGGVIGGAYAAFEAVIAPRLAQTASVVSLSKVRAPPTPEMDAGGDQA
jgi:hypothetical protein